MDGQRRATCMMASSTSVLENLLPFRVFLRTTILKYFVYFILFL